MWISGNTSSDNVDYLYVQGSYQLVANLIHTVPISGFGNWDGTLTVTGQTLASIQANVKAFVDEAGYPWAVIGDITTGNGAVAAVNLSKVFAINPLTNGLAFNGSSLYTSGYAPYANYADAKAAILQMQSEYTF